MVGWQGAMLTLAVTSALSTSALTPSRAPTPATPGLREFNVGLGPGGLPKLNFQLREGRYIDEDENSDRAGGVGQGWICAQEDIFGEELHWFNSTATGLPHIPPIVIAQMTKQDLGDLERILNLAPDEISNGGDEKTVARLRGRSRLLVNYLRQRLVRLEEGTVATVPELFPRLFEEADMVHALQEGYVTRWGIEAPGEDDGVFTLVKHLQRIEDSDVAPVEPLDVSLWAAADSGNVTGILNALEAGAMVNSTGPRSGRMSALHIAAKRGHVDCIKALLERGADVHSQTVLGRTPLHIVADREDAVEALIRGGADAAKMDSFADTPLNVAAANGNGESARALVAAGSDLETANSMGDAPWQTALRCAKHENGTKAKELELLGAILKPLVISAPGTGISGKKRERESVWQGIQVVEVRAAEQGGGGLAPTVSMGDIVRIMGGKVKVEMCRIVRPKKGRQGDYYALVRFRSPDLAAEVVRAQGKTLSGRPLVIRHTVEPIHARAASAPGVMGQPQSDSSDRDDADREPRHGSPYDLSDDY